MRICLVTPFAWPQPHDVNEHVAGAADGLRRRGHDVTVIAPSTRSTDLQAGRRALQRGELPEVLAIGQALPVSRTSALAVPVGVRANLRHALAVGRFDVVHGFEAGLPSLSYAALLEAECLTAATFVAPERLGSLRKAARDRLRARVDVLLATSSAAALAAEAEFASDVQLVPAGVDTDLFRPASKQDLLALQLESAARPLLRAALRALDELPDWSAICLHTKPLGVRPAVPARLRGRVAVRSTRRPHERAELLGAANVFVPLPGGHTRLWLEAAAAGCAIVDPPGSDGQPELVTAAIARLGENPAHLADEAGRAREAAERESFARLAEQLDTAYHDLARKPRRRENERRPAEARPRILVDLHMHTSASHDCSIEPAELVEHALAIGLGAIAVTDHNVFSGALETVAAARATDLVVIPGEEMKTDAQGEVIGLFLRDEIPGGLTFADTIAAIREQEGIVYLPHPFDRRHAIPAPATLHRHLAEIDVLEVYNARLLKEAYNDEALRFARKYGLLQGAGSDAHVLPGVGTGVLRMAPFDGPEEFLLAVRTAEVLRRPKSLAYLQSLKWVAQARDRLTTPS